MIKALIFDFDGLILDTETPEFEMWQEIYAEHGCRLDLNAWAACIGRAADSRTFDPYAFLEEQLGRPIDRDGIRAKRGSRNLEMNVWRKVMPGVDSYLQDARSLGLKLAIASSSPVEWVGGHLKRLGIDGCFDHLSCADLVGRGKPDPSVYFDALEALDARADQAIAFEDSPNGALAAKRAGIFCVVVPNGVTRQLQFDQVDHMVNSLAELPLSSLLERFR